MELPGLIYRGAPLDDVELLERLPLEVAQLLAQRNGFVALGGALHVRGASSAPAWHSLREAWEGPAALHRLFPTVRPEDLPLAQTATGDQFLLRQGRVHRLRAAQGAHGVLEPTDLELTAFLDAVFRDPIETLGDALDALRDFHDAGGRLAPGELLARAADGSWRSVPVAERLAALARAAGTAEPKRPPR